MERVDAIEAVDISKRCLDNILRAAPTRGHSGSELRTAIGAFEANAEVLFIDNVAGQPLVEIFDLAVKANITVNQFTFVNNKIAEEAPSTVGGILTKNSLIYLTLASQSTIIANMKFASRDDVEAMVKVMNDGFLSMEEVAADDMAQLVYQKLIATHAAVIFYLMQTSRPLPRMINYRFNDVRPTLYYAYRLYADASRADELRVENKVVHPAFAPLFGRGMSS